ncbi:MAG TPA: efflux RND transporter periplasmic adaptor subunit [Bauldia sp.]|nr:efflux RND transporter periplasmic adaptor subunit [Bauldia sp.]
MASRIFRPSRVIAVVLVVLAAVWIFSGRLGQKEPEAATVSTASGEVAAPATAAVPIQKVAVATATPEQHQRAIILSCTTRADHRAQATARGAGTVVELNISRGTKVKAGDIVATLSDEARTAAVQQAQAQLDKAQSDYNANSKLIQTGDAPRNSLATLEAGVKSAQAALAAAQAEADRSVVRAPIDGIVDTVPVQVGQAVQIGGEVAEIVDPDPMLAVGSVSEARRASLLVGQSAEVRFIDGKKVSGSVDFVGLSADKATRTYPVEVKMPNPTSEIADGVTCEMTVLLAPIEAAAVPRSALVFSDDGRLGVRIADPNSKAQFVPVNLVDDGLSQVWVTGLQGVTRVIVVGQDFVKDGDPVEAVTAEEATPQEPPA